MYLSAGGIFDCLAVDFGSGHFYQSIKIFLHLLFTAKEAIFTWNCEEILIIPVHPFIMIIIKWTRSGVELILGK